MKFWKFDRERAKPSPKKITSRIFQVKNSTMKLSEFNIFREYVKKLKVKSSTRPRPQTLSTLLSSRIKGRKARRSSCPFCKRSLPCLRHFEKF